MLLASGQRSASLAQQKRDGKQTQHLRCVALCSGNGNFRARACVHRLVGFSRNAAQRGVYDGESRRSLCFGVPQRKQGVRGFPALTYKQGESFFVAKYVNHYMTGLPVPTNVILRK